MVKGRVTVEVLEDVEFREAQVRFTWHTEGKGNRVTGEGGTETLARGGKWLAGETHDFSFEIPAPFGPLSYGGKILRVLWALEARLDRSLLRSDVVEGIAVLLQGVPEPEHAILGPVPQEKSQLEAVKKGRVGAWVAVGTIFLLIGIFYGAAQGWELRAPERMIVLLLLGGGLFITLRGFWGRLGRGKLGEPTVQLSTSELRRGEEIRFSVSIRPEQRTELRSLEVILECEERVIQGHGQYQSRHKRTVFEQRLILAKDLVIEPHRGLKKKGTLTLPLDASPSFGAPHNQLIWWLHFQGDIVGWPDWKEPVLLTVWP
ncbi:MAG: hypothetical protein ABIF09_06890 [Gemmatimonadota bacterium]